MKSQEITETATGRRVWLNVVLGTAVLLLLSGCADSVNFADAATREPVGFWYGFLHGVILPISWVISLFSDDVAIYAIYNNGGWYDFGFTLGAGGLVASSSKAA